MNVSDKQYPNNKIDESLDTSETRDNVDSWDIKNGNNKVEHAPSKLKFIIYTVVVV